MSKDIAFSDVKSLNFEDFEYLRLRGRLTAKQEEEYLSKASKSDKAKVEALASLEISMEDIPNTGDVNTLPDEADDDYEDWSKAELVEEINARNEMNGDSAPISPTGTIDNLVKRLRSDDGEGEA